MTAHRSLQKSTNQPIQPNQHNQASLHIVHRTSNIVHLTSYIPPHSPCTTSILVFAARWRMSLALVYSGEDHHSLARSTEGNSRMTILCGCQLPSSGWLSPPRTTKRPPKAEMDAGVNFLYSSYKAGSCISISTIT